MKERTKTAKALVMALGVAAGLVIAAPAADAGGVTYTDGEKYVKLGGRVQVQYHQTDPDGSDSTDELFFRRLRPYIEGSIHEDWLGKFQFDLGGASDDDEIDIKDAYMQYKGLDNVTVTLGNAYTRFSREALTSSKYQQLVERTFVGDHNYGSPDRNLGLHAAGTAMDGKLVIGVDLAAADLDPDSNKLDFDTPVNRDSDFNQGWMVAGRVDFHPFGYLKMSQGDLERDELKATVSVAAFTWSNDGDNNTRTTNGVADDDSKPDVDKVTGFEVSGAFRYMGVSVDAEYNIFDAETIDSTVTSGIYKNGETELTNYAIEGGYMVLPSRLEIVAAFQAQDADNYAETWTRTSFGANYFIKEHDIKLQGTYRMGKNIDGADGSDTDEIFVQAQYVF